MHLPVSLMNLAFIVVAFLTLIITRGTLGQEIKLSFQFKSGPDQKNVGKVVDGGDGGDDRTAIMKAITGFQSTGSAPKASSFVVYSDTATVLMTSNSIEAYDAEELYTSRYRYNAISVAARAQDGRVIAFGETEHCDSDVTYDESKDFCLQAFKWLIGSRSPNEVKVGLFGTFKTTDLPLFLTQNDFAYGTVADEMSSLDQYQMIIVSDVGKLTTSQASLLSAYLTSGGSLFLSGNPYADAMYNIDTYPGNVIVQDVAGFRWTPQDSVEAAYLTSDAGDSDSINMVKAWTKLRPVFTTNTALNRTSESANMYLIILKHGLKVVPKSATLPQMILSDIDSAGQKVIPTNENPVTSMLDKQRIYIDTYLSPYLKEPEEIKSHPCSSEFPGNVDSSSASTQTVTINPRPRNMKNGRSRNRFSRSIPHRIRDIELKDGPLKSVASPMGYNITAFHSTGLYVPPGQVISISVSSKTPVTTLAQYATIQIGSHTDVLGFDSTDEDSTNFHRCPVVFRIETIPLTIDTDQLRINTLFGGLLYVRTPVYNDMSPITLTVDGVVKAPWFVKGHTDRTAWKKKIRSFPGAWGEIGTDKMILTLPSTALNSLDDPTIPLKFWDSVIASDVDFGRVPDDQLVTQRMLPDVQPSVGYMHASYPIVSGMDSVQAYVNTSKASMVGTGPDDGWGWSFFHEIGHNFQEDKWTWNVVGEVTNNVFVMYNMDTLLKVPLSSVRADFKQDVLRTAIQGYIDKGTDPKQLNFALALYPYFQLKQNFGWDAYKRVFSIYRDPDQVKGDTALPTLWIQIFSKAVGQDLFPMYESWGFKYTDDEKSVVSNLPKTKIRISDLLSYTEEK